MPPRDRTRSAPLGARPAGRDEIDPVGGQRSPARLRGKLVSWRSAGAAMRDWELRTKRWNDPVAVDDGHRLLVCRYRPRGVRKEAETWDEWLPQLGPSRELHADYYGKRGPALAWPEYRRRYLAEMRAQRQAIAALAQRVAAGERITLLCSSACSDPRRCHRTLLKELIESALPPPARAGGSFEAHLGAGARRRLRTPSSRTR